jgi:hypothetical protein
VLQEPQPQVLQEREHPDEVVMRNNWFLTQNLHPQQQLQCLVMLAD